MSCRVGLMGGTFDPVHIGHLRAAEEAVEMLGLDSLLFVLSSAPPHKPGEKIVAFEDRRRMLELALEGRPGFRLSDVERSLPGKSYTVNTLRLLHGENQGGAEFFFLLGMDAFFELDTWWRYRELFELAHMVVLRRPGHPDEAVGAFLKEKVSIHYTGGSGSCSFEHPQLLSVHLLHNTHFGVSSTQVRALAAAGKSIRYLVLPEVMNYIEKNNLYHFETVRGER